MKVVIGVDLGGAYKVGMALFNGLGLGASSMHFVNVVEPLMPDGGFPELAASNPMALILDDLQNAGREVLASAVADFPGSSSQLVFGGAAASMVEAAVESQADLIIVGSQQKSLIESLFAGSVTKSLTVGCKQSVLVGKQLPKSESGLVVVFAHDMSDYSDKAVEKFVSYAPKGVSRIVLVTADTTDPSIVAVVERIEPDMAGETLDILHSRLDNRQNEIAARLRTVCSDVDLVVSEGKANDVINETMSSSNADLLVMGAHGHGFIERLVVGSVALHQVVREPHNVLLLRA